MKRIAHLRSPGLPEPTGMKIVLSHSDDPISRDAATELVAHARQELGTESPKAGLLFASVEYEQAECLAVLREAWPDLPIIGGSSDGEISSSLGFRHDSLLLILFAGEDLEVRACVGRDLAADPEAALDAAIESLGDFDPSLCITTFAPTTDSSAVVRRLSQAFPDCTLVGGLTGDHGEFSTITEFFGDEVLNDSIPLLFLSGKFSKSYGIGSGWFPIGEPRTITRSDGHLVHEIDGRPALEIYREHYGSAPIQSLGEYPLAVYEDEGDWTLRAILDSDEEGGSLRFAGQVPEGAQVRMTEVQKEGILSGSAESLGEAFRSYPGQAPALALIFTCAARKWVLGSEAEQEIVQLRERAAQEGCPSLHVAGLYCFGEIAPPLPARASRFHNETCVSLLLGN